MSCQSVQERISWFLDRPMPDAERELLSAHLESCPSCSAYLYSIENVRTALRNLGKPSVPAGLVTQLRVIASHERSRNIARSSLSARLRDWNESIGLFVDNLMRPWAVPVTGGLLSALILFGMLVPKLSFHHNFTDDLQLSMFSDPDGRLVQSLPADGAPTWLLTTDSPRLESVNAVVSGDETVLELTIDETGRVVDYSVNRGHQLTPEMVDIILFSRFTPASFNGRSTWGKKLVVFHSHRRRNVRG